MPDGDHQCGMLSDTLHFATEPVIRDAVRAILKDEVSHSRMGWAHLEAERQHGRGDFLSHAFVSMFEQAGVDEIFDPEDRLRDSPALAAHGELSLDRRTGIFRGAVGELILPGWEAAGLDISAARTWLQRFEL